MGIRNLESINIAFMESPGFKPQMVRSKITNTDDDILRDTRVAFEEGSNLDDIDSIEAVSSFITYSTNPKMLFKPPEGWGEHRYSIVITYTTTVSGTNTRNINRLCGYTDYMGAIVRNGRIIPDGNMMIYLNSLIVISESVRLDHRTHKSIVDSRIVSNVQFVNPGSQDDRSSDILMMRPSDIASKISSEHDPMYALQTEDTIIVDTRNILTGVKYIPRSINSRTQYMRQLFSAYRQSLNNMEYDGDNGSVSSSGKIFNTDDDDDEYEGIVTQDINTHDHWKRVSKSVGASTRTANVNELYLKLQTQMSNFAREGSFSWDDLTIVFDPINLEDNLNLFKMNVEDAAFSDYSSPNTGNTNTDIAGSILINELPSLMTRYGLVSLKFNATNRTVNGEIYTSILGYHSMGGSGEVNERIIELIEHTINSEVIYNISFKNQIAFNIDAEINLFGLYKLDIDMGEGMVSYCAPLYMDSAINSNLTKSEDDVLAFATDIEQLLDGPSNNQYNHSRNSIIKDLF